MARPGPALFELIRDKSNSRHDTPAPPVAPAPSPPTAAAPRPVIHPPSAPAPGFALQERVSITMSTVWLALGGLILVAIVIYVLAFSLGRKTGERDVLKDLNKGSGGSVTEPLHGGAQIPVNPNLITPTPPRQSTIAAPAASTGPTPGSASGDPRIAGFNYLTIASKLDRDTAERAVAFLSENGVKSFAIAVAKAGSGANNPSTYTLYALQGITREELRARAPVRTDLEERIARLGKTWQKEHKGQTDFSKTYWDKFGS